MIHYKRNLMVALIAVGAIAYLTVPGFYGSGDFWRLVNAGGRWYLFLTFAVISQVVLNVTDGITNQKGWRTTATESFFVVPLMYAVAIALLCAGTGVWNAGGKGAADYTAHAKGVFEKRNQHEAAEAGGL